MRDRRRHRDDARTARGGGRGVGGAVVSLAGVAAALSLVACSDGASNPPDTNPEPINKEFTCDLDLDFIADGNVGRGGIPFLTDPPLVGTDARDELDYLDDEDRVAGLFLDGRPIAISLNTLWWHEIVNLNGQEARMAVTLCPLTGSTLAFDRSAIGGRELSVSGVLFKSNLVMVGVQEDRDRESLWPQMLREARCGPATGTDLGPFRMVEVTWGWWKSRYPGTVTVTGDLPFPNRDWSVYPYGNYKVEDNGEYHFPVPENDPRRPPKERSLGLPPVDGDPGIVFPFGALEDQPGKWAVVETTYRGEERVVFWSTPARGAMAFDPELDGRRLTFEVTDQGIADRETGTLWSVDGRAKAGPLVGESLDPVLEAYVAFWASWAHFFPETRLWTG